MCGCFNVWLYDKLYELQMLVKYICQRYGGCQPLHPHHKMTSGISQDLREVAKKPAFPKDNTSEAACFQHKFLQLPPGGHPSRSL